MFSGKEALSIWADFERSLPIVKGEENPLDERHAWEWLRNPFPPGDEDPVFASLRHQLGIPNNSFFTDRGFGSLSYFEQESVVQTLVPGFYREHNPIMRHTVLRRRQTLEEAGLLDRVGVEVPSCGGRYREGLPGRRIYWLGSAYESPFRPCLPSGG